MAGVRRSLFGATVVLALVPAAAAVAQDVTCYVDSVGGNDSQSGLLEAEAVKSQAKIGSTCTMARFKRGSIFNEALKITTKVKTYANYGDAPAPLPQFALPHTSNSGSIVYSYQGGITIDGLYLGFSHGDGTVNGLGKGVCVNLGGSSQLINNEISNCDIGIMLIGHGLRPDGGEPRDQRRHRALEPSCRLSQSRGPRPERHGRYRRLRVRFDGGVVAPALVARR